ncbi:uncharacterized protein A4U43_C01F19830 [Asparagus officinalis]|uniref:RRM Nup35-type domain-containing protein n=1 Tax=Asparagus officinalis TaxID=4686 RepID=A0A5P1FQP5_ASPOF|nr:uncharacterized protein A4U43_C01F19830 [Asparagus officinalis]
MLPPPREVARPEMRSQTRMARDGMLDEEEWVTVYGFSPGDTNLVLCEFEKCGVILKHILGPRDANWMHILYQNRYDAQKALGKNGVQLNSVLIIGVKPIDPMQRQYLNESQTSNIHGGFMVSLPLRSTSARSSALSPVAASYCPAYLQNGGTVTNDGGRRSTSGAIASPAKSVVSKVMDLMFGF